MVSPQLQTLSLVVFLAGLVSSAPSVTTPIASTTWTPGSQVVTWKDDGKANASSKYDIELWAGDSTKQVMLAVLATNVSSDALKKTVTISAKEGPSGSDYFFRLHPSGFNNQTSDIFSSLFTLQNMTGTFNASVESQIGLLTASTTIVGNTTQTSSIKPTSASTTPAPVLSGNPSSSSSGQGAAATNPPTSSASTLTPRNLAYLSVMGLIATACIF